MGLFIPHDKLENLKLYKYSSEDHSLISRFVLKKWWNSFVLIFPMSLAPNVITLLGLMFVILNVLCVAYYDPYLNTDSPRWVYFFHAFGLFMYQTFDGCDGCHARRTGQSGPLGELFDHSIDAINTTLGCFIFGSVFQLGYSWLFLIAQFAAACNFYSSTWEEYHTHTLYLSEFSGPVEGILIMCALYVVTGIFGPDIWKINIITLDLSSFGFSSEFVITSTHLSSFGGLAQLYFNISSAMGNVAKKYRLDSTLLRKESKDRLVSAALGLAPFFAYYMSFGLYAYFYPEIVSIYAVPVVISMGLTVAFCVGRIIVAHLTMQEFPYFQAPTFLPVCQLLVTRLLVEVFGYDRKLTLASIIWMGAGLSFGIHATFVTDIIVEITGYLDIYALFIKHKRV